MAAEFPAHIFLSGEEFGVGATSSEWLDADLLRDVSYLNLRNGEIKYIVRGDSKSSAYGYYYEL